MSKETSFYMHVACFNEEVRELLGLATSDDDEDDEIETSMAKFSDGATERVSIIKMIYIRRRN